MFYIRIGAGLTRIGEQGGTNERRSASLSLSPSAAASAADLSAHSSSRCTQQGTSLSPSSPGSASHCQPKPRSVSSSCTSPLERHESRGRLGGSVCPFVLMCGGALLHRHPFSHSLFSSTEEKVTSKATRVAIVSTMHSLFVSRKHPDHDVCLMALILSLQLDLCRLEMEVRFEHAAFSCFHLEGWGEESYCTFPASCSVIGRV